MSWLFSRALVAEYSAGTFSDGEPCAPLNVMPTPHPFWHKGKTMDASSPSRFGLTLQLLTEDRGQELLMSYLAAFPARTSALPARAPGSKGSGADFGGTWLGLLAKFDRNSSSWRTAQCSLLEGLDEFSGTWPRWGSMRNGVCLERGRLASSISATASGYSLPTPSGVNGGNNNTMGRVDEWGGQLQPFAWDRNWLDVFTRVRRAGDGLAYNVDRTDTIRNGQVPRVAAAAFNLLGARFEHQLETNSSRGTP